MTFHDVGACGTDPADLERAITGETSLVTTMHANNKVGTVQPLVERAEIVHRRGAPMHTDAAQSMGNMPVRVDDLGVNLLSITGHKPNAAIGTGGLISDDRRQC
jgi:cysteine desulfurase